MSQISRLISRFWWLLDLLLFIWSFYHPGVEFYEILIESGSKSELGFCIMKTIVQENTSTKKMEMQRKTYSIHCKNLFDTDDIEISIWICLHNTYSIGHDSLIYVFDNLFAFACIEWSDFVVFCSIQVWEHLTHYIILCASRMLINFSGYKNY